MKRIVLDGLLFVLLILLMGFQVLPKPLHAALGIIMGVFVLLHLMWNGKWFSSLGRGAWNARRAASVVVNLGLTVSFAVALVSGLAIANRLFPGLFRLFGGSERAVWLALGFSLCILIPSLFQVILRLKKPSSLQNDICHE